MKTRKHIKPNMKIIFLALIFLATTLAAHAQSWTNRFNGSANLDDGATAIAVDGSGNAIVTGWSSSIVGGSECVTIKYSASGLPLWTNRYQGLTTPSAGIAIAVDAVGSAFVPSGYAALIKYSSAGVPLWTNYYSGEGETAPAAIAVDSLGNACVTGYSADTNGIIAFLTVKYSSAGVPLWTNRYNNSPQYSRADGVAVDKEDNVIVSGTTFDDFHTNVAYLTLKYSSAGVPLWTNLHSLNQDGFMSGLAVDGAGNIFVTGVAADLGNFASADIVTIAYSSGGVPLWTNRFQGEAGFEDVALAAAVDNHGNLFVAGYSRTGSSYDYLTLKYSGTGVPLWTNYYDGPMGSDDILQALAVDKNGNAFVTGIADFSNLGLTGSEMETVAYSSEGLQLWAHNYANGLPRGLGGALDHAGRRIVADPVGNVFATGESWNGTNFDYLTIKYAAEASAPLLNIQRLGNNIVLSWTNAAFGLQSAPAITGTFTNVPGAANPYTNALSGGQRFFRLAQ